MQAGVVPPPLPRLPPSNLPPILATDRDPMPAARRHGYAASCMQFCKVCKVKGKGEEGMTSSNTTVLRLSEESHH